MEARSYLFVPGDRQERIAKALATEADAIVIDLEDAVTPEAKNDARIALSNWLRTASRPERILIRINGCGTPWHLDDVAMLRAAGVHQFVMPKADDAGHLHAAASAVSPHAKVVALIESVVGVIHVRSIAACPVVSRIAFGAVDFAADSGIEGTGRELDYVRSQLVLESRYAGLAAPIDGVTLALDDMTALTEDIADARRFGFGGKLAIHPKQVDAINRGFSPGDDEKEWAQRVLSAAAGNPLGAFTVDGKMVDKPVIERANRIARAAG